LACPGIPAADEIDMRSPGSPPAGRTEYAAFLVEPDPYFLLFGLGIQDERLRLAVGLPNLDRAILTRRGEELSVRAIREGQDTIRVPAQCIGFETPPDKMPDANHPSTRTHGHVAAVGREGNSEVTALRKSAQEERNGAAAPVQYEGLVVDCGHRQPASVP